MAFSLSLEFNYHEKETSKPAFFSIISLIKTQLFLLSLSFHKENHIFPEI